MKTAVYINQIEAVVPPYEGHSKSIDFLLRFVGSEEECRKFLVISKRLGIEKRYTVLKHFFDQDGRDPHAFYRLDGFPSTAERMARYKEEAPPLAANALERLLAKGDRKDITHLIVTSCTGFYAPGLDIDIVQKFNLSSKTERTIIGYMGCYAAISGLKLAQHIVQAQKRAKVLMVNLELCTLHWRKDHVPFDQLLSCLLFADGCAASLISAEPVGLGLEGFHSTVLPDSLDLMGWTIGDDGFFMNLDASLPKRLSQGLKKDERNVLQNRSPQDFSFWAVHPGGRSILDEVKVGLDLGEAAMAPSYSVLKNYGNMSSPTVMFILKQFLNEKNDGGLGCAIAFGPGLVLESFIFFKG